MTGNEAVREAFLQLLAQSKSFQGRTCTQGDVVLLSGS